MRHAGGYLFTAVTVALLLILAGGCTDDDTKCPVCPGCSDPPSPTMDNLWPNDDGNSWTYDWAQRLWEPIPATMYESPDDVPPIPSLDYVEGLLDDQPAGSEPDSSYGIYRLEFEGTGQTSSGADGQNLTETVFEESTGDVTVIPPQAVFFQRLSLARPDLRDALQVKAGGSFVPAGPASLLTVGQPLFLHGGIWEKASGYIGSYGDVDTFLAWKYLEEDVSEGHEFTFQLVPSLASDVFLNFRVIGHGTVETGHGRYENAVECLYQVDYGLAVSHTIYGDRYFRVYDFGTVVYAPGVGPVESYERMVIYTSDPDGPGAGDNSLGLIGARSE
jgi:hypothetical protein